jgi:CO dehydrogenase maturation factor
MGRGEGSGCYCYLNTLVRKFSEELFPIYKWIVMDNEAGLEHISRRTTHNIDSLIIVVNDNPISLNTARNIKKLTENLKSAIKNEYIITNMIGEDRKQEMKKRVQDLGMEYLTDMPFDRSVSEIVFQGKPLSELKNSPVKGTIQKIIEKIGGRDGNS